MTVTSNIYLGLVGWSNATYAVGARRSNSGNAYEVVTGGTSTAPPTGTGSSINNGGTAVWKYLTAADYTTLAAWEAGIPTTLTQPVVGLLWNCGEYNVAFATQIMDLSGHTTSSTNTITLQPATGEGFAAKYIAAPTTALAYNAANGVSIKLAATGTASNTNYINIGDNYVTIKGIQFLDPNSGGGGTYINGTGTNITITGCIVDGYSQAGGADMIFMHGSNNILSNNLIIDRGTAAASFTARLLGTASAAVNNIFIQVTSTSGRAALDSGNTTSTGVQTSKNNIFIGYPDLVYAASSGTPWATSNCAYASANFSSNLNATDAGGSLFSQTSSGIFVNYPTDFNTKSGASVLNAGVTDTTDIPGAIDIFGNSRPQGASWDIGAVERLASSAVTRDYTSQIVWNYGLLADRVIQFERTGPVTGDQRIPIDWLNPVGSQAMTAFPLEILQNGNSLILWNPYSGDFSEAFGGDPVSYGPYSGDFSEDFGGGPVSYVFGVMTYIEWVVAAASAARNVAIPLEWGNTAAINARVPVESKGTSRNDVVGPTEWRSGIQADRLVPLERRGSIRADQTTSVEELDVVQLTHPTAVEWQLSTAFGVNTAVAIEWRSSALRDIVSPIEFGAPGVSRDETINVEWRASMVANQLSNIEWRGSLVADAVVPTDRSGSLVLDRLGPIEWVQGASGSSSMPQIEWRATTVRSDIVPAEWSLSVKIDAINPVAWSGGSGMVGDAVVAIDWSHMESVSREAAVDWSASAVAQATAPVEYLVGPGRTFQATIEWGLSAASSAIAPIEFIQSTLGLTGIHPIPLEMKRQLIVDFVVSLDRPLGTDTIGAQLEPDQWESDHASI